MKGAKRAPTRPLRGLLIDEPRGKGLKPGLMNFIKAGPAQGAIEADQSEKNSKDFQK